jgi:hypothetical protein
MARTLRTIIVLLIGLCTLEAAAQPACDPATKRAPAVTASDETILQLAQVNPDAAAFMLLLRMEGGASVQWRSGQTPYVNVVRTAATVAKQLERAPEDAFPQTWHTLAADRLAHSQWRAVDRADGTVRLQITSPLYDASMTPVGRLHPTVEVVLAGAMPYRVEGWSVSSD